MSNQNSKTKMGAEKAEKMKIRHQRRVAMELTFRRNIAMEIRGRIGIMAYLLHVEAHELLEVIEMLDDQRVINKLIAELQSVSCAFIK